MNGRFVKGLVRFAFLAAPFLAAASVAQADIPDISPSGFTSRNAAVLADGAAVLVSF